MKQYKIHYEVDTGWDYCKDTAIVKAEDEDAAVKKLKSYISSIDNECMVSEVFYVKEFTEEIFSDRFRHKRR